VDLFDIGKKKFINPNWHSNSLVDYARNFDDEEDEHIQFFIGSIINYSNKFSIPVTLTYMIKELTDFNIESSITWLGNKLSDWGYSDKVSNVPELRKNIIENYNRFLDFLSMIEIISKNDWVNIRFIDDIHFHFNGPKMKKIKKWCKRGVPAIVIDDENKEDSTYSMVMLTTLANINQPCFYTLEENSSSSNMTQFLYDCANRGFFQENDLIIINNAPCHTSPESIKLLNQISQCLKCQFIFQPAYCPYFNVCEYVFDVLKVSMTGDYSEKSISNKVAYHMNSMSWELVFEFYSSVFNNSKNYFSQFYGDK